MELWQRVIKHESTHLISLKANLLILFILFICGRKQQCCRHALGVYLCALPAASLKQGIELNTDACVLSCRSCTATQGATCSRESSWSQ